MNNASSISRRSLLASGLACGAAIGAGPAVLAGQLKRPPVFVELFTSQGCSTGPAPDGRYKGSATAERLWPPIPAASRGQRQGFPLGALTIRQGGSCGHTSGALMLAAAPAARSDAFLTLLDEIKKMKKEALGL